VWLPAVRSTRPAYREPAIPRMTHSYQTVDDTGSALSQARAKRCASKDQMDCLTRPAPLRCGRALYIPAGATDHEKA
jgi:hypothetical protein